MPSLWSVNTNFFYILTPFPIKCKYLCRSLLLLFKIKETYNFIIFLSIVSGRRKSIKGMSSCNYPGLQINFGRLMSKYLESSHSKQSESQWTRYYIYLCYFFKNQILPNRFSRNFGDFFLLSQKLQANFHFLSNLHS